MMHRDNQSQKSFIIFCAFVIFVVFIYIIGNSPEQNIFTDLVGEASGVTKICADTDGGQLQDIFGTVTVSTTRRGRTTAKTYQDTCTNNKVKEFYCQGNNVKNKKITCALGCNGGQCISPPLAVAAPPPAPQSVCGNGIIETGEQCDSNLVACTTLGLQSGDSMCKSDCSGYDRWTCTSQRRLYGRVSRSYDGILTTRFCLDGTSNCFDAPRTVTWNGLNLETSTNRASVSELPVEIFAYSKVVNAPVPDSLAGCRDAAGEHVQVTIFGTNVRDACYQRYYGNELIEYGYIKSYVSYIPESGRFGREGWVEIIFAQK